MVCLKDLVEKRKDDGRMRWRRRAISGPAVGDCTVEGMSCVAESVQSFAMTCFSSTSTHPLILYRTIIAHMVFRYMSDEEGLELFHTYPCEPCRGGADGRFESALFCGV